MIEKILLEFLRDSYAKDISLDTFLIKEGYVDSFSIVELLVFIEKTFGINMPSDKVLFENFDSVKQIVNMIQKLQNEQK